jgi:malonate decarboxylase alpha subunit
MALPPVMIYGDDVTHILTEEGIANLLLCRSDEERAQAIRGVAGYTQVGLARDHQMVERLRARGVIRRAEDLGIDKRMATRDLLAARSIKDLVRASEACTSLRNNFAIGDTGALMERWNIASLEVVSCIRLRHGWSASSFGQSRSPDRIRGARRRVHRRNQHGCRRLWRNLERCRSRFFRASLTRRCPHFHQ